MSATLWRCTNCGHETHELPRTSSLDPRFTVAPCNKSLGGCGAKRATHRLIGTIELEGDEQKQRGMDAATEATQRSDPSWVARFDTELERRAASGVSFTSEDVTHAVGQPPSSGAVGARINAAARRGIIEHVGYTKARRANQHGAELRTWRGVNRG